LNFLIIKALILRVSWRLKRLDAIWGDQRDGGGI